MKKILHLRYSDFYGGPEKQIIEHSRILQDHVFDIHIVSFIPSNNHQNGFLDVAENAGLHSAAILSKTALDIDAIRHIKDYLTSNHINLLCVHGYKPSVLGWLASRKLSIPVIAFARGYTTENIKVAFYEWLERRAWKRMNAIIAVSEDQKNKLLNYGIKKTPIYVVHNAINVNTHSANDSHLFIEPFRSEWGIPSGAVLAVTAGRLSPEKGHRYLVEAAELLKEKQVPIHFVFCGDGALLPSLKDQAKQLGVDHICHFIGFKKDMQKIYAIMDFFVLPSLTEGLPNVALETFAAKKPIVATSVGGVPEVVEDNISGFLVPPKRPDLLAEKILQMASSRELRKKMGQAGYERVRKDFSFEDQARKLQAIYRRHLAD